jgi:hypothetical protein
MVELFCASAIRSRSSGNRNEDVKASADNVKATVNNITRVISDILKGRSYPLIEIRRLLYKRNRHGLTIVHAAVISGNAKLWHDLLHETSVDINEKVCHKSQLWWSRRHGLEVIEKMLLSRGADDNDMAPLNPWVSTNSG